MDPNSSEGKEREVKAGEEEKEEKVELTPEQYHALLDDAMELEALKAGKHKEKEEEEELGLEKLVKEGKKSKVKEEESEELPDLDNMTNTQLANLILKEVNKRNDERFNPIELTVETLRMLREIDKAESKHEDFWDYGEQVQKMCIANPNLSVERAYIIAKAESPSAKDDKGKGEKEPVVTKTERLLKLPPRVHGERPTSVAGTASSDKGKTIKSAAEKAWEDTLKDRNSI